MREQPQLPVRGLPEPMIRPLDAIKTAREASRAELKLPRYFSISWTQALNSSSDSLLERSLMD